jgi:hypothetical protein
MNHSFPYSPILSTVKVEATDHRLDGYSTTIGPQEFHNYKKNMINPVAALQALKPGRKPKVWCPLLWCTVSHPRAEP